jgi:hypothetical protein
MEHAAPILRLLRFFPFNKQKPLWQRLEGIPLYHSRVNIWLQVVQEGIADMAGNHHTLELDPVIIQLYVDLREPIWDVVRVDHWIPKTFQNKHREDLKVQIELPEVL